MLDKPIRGSLGPVPGFVQKPNEQSVSPDHDHEKAMTNIKGHRTAGKHSYKFSAPKPLKMHAFQGTTLLNTSDF